MARETKEYTLICGCGNTKDITRIWARCGLCETGYNLEKCEKCGKFFAYEVEQEDFGKLDFKNNPACLYIKHHTPIGHLDRDLKKEMLPEYAVKYFFDEYNNLLPCKRPRRHF